MIVSCEGVELRVREQLVCEECAGKEGVGEPCFDADERVEGQEQVREYGVVMNATLVGE